LRDQIQRSSLHLLARFVELAARHYEKPDDACPFDSVEDAIPDCLLHCLSFHLTYVLEEVRYPVTDHLLKGMDSEMAAAPLAFQELHDVTWNL
jgi:hypothetical protein